MSIEKKLDQIILALKELDSRLARMEQRQNEGLEEIKENAPPVIGSFGTVAEKNPS